MDQRASVRATARPSPSQSVSGARPFAITHTNGITRIELIGRITGADILRAADAVIADPGFKPCQPLIWDGNGITRICLDTGQAWKRRVSTKKYAWHLGQRTGHVAVVAPRGIDRTVAEFIRWHLMGRPVEAFADMDEARAWVLET